MQKQSEERKLRPKQKQRRPGKRSEMRSVPHAEPVKQENKLEGKVAGFGSEPPSAGRESPMKWLPTFCSLYPATRPT